MPQQDFSVGRDIQSVTINTPFGILAPSLVTDFSAKPEVSKKKSKGLTDGLVRTIVMQEGYNGTIELDRKNQAVDRFFAQLEAAYYAGQNIGYSTIMQTIQEKDGTISQFQFVGVVLVLEDAGHWKTDELVHMKLMFEAQQRIVVS